MNTNFSTDGGYASRKFWFAMVCLVGIIAASVISPTVTIAEVIAGIVAVCVVYVGGNVVNKFNIATVMKQTATEAPAQIPPPKEDVTKKEDLTNRE